MQLELRRGGRELGRRNNSQELFKTELRQQEKIQDLKRMKFTHDN